MENGCWVSSLQIITLSCSVMWISMKSHQEVWGLSKDGKIAKGCRITDCVFLNPSSNGERCRKWQVIPGLQWLQDWWNESYDWSAGMEGYQLFKRVQQGRRGAAALHVREKLDCTVLAFSDDGVKSLWVRIKGQIRCLCGCLLLTAHLGQQHRWLIL